MFKTHNIYAFFIMMIICNIHIAYSQKLSDTIAIPEIIIYESDGFKISKIDTIEKLIFQNSNLGDLLQDNGMLYLKNYGNGQLKTSSIRGAGAVHTKVIWNGIELNSPMLGQFDFSSFPVFFADEISVIPGGSNSKFYSNSAGGIIDISTLPDNSKNLNISANASYSNLNAFGSNLSLTKNYKRLSFSTAYSELFSKNDFKYSDPPFNENSKVHKFENGDYFNRNFQQQVHFRNSSNSMFSAILWLQKNFYHLQLAENDGQFKDATRAVVKWQKFTDKVKIDLNSSYQYSFMKYLNSESDIESLNRTDNFAVNGTYRLKLTEISDLKGGFKISNSTVTSNNYEEKKDRISSSLFIDLNSKLFDKRLNSNLALKINQTDENYSAWLPGISVDYKLFKNKKLWLKSNLQSIYREPTLNELYWKDYGNSELKAENGFSSEIGLTNKFIKSWFEIENEITYFYSYIENWIQWTPSESTSDIWFPENLKTVFRRGIELSNELNFTINNINISSKTNYTFLNATEEFDNESSANSYQLIFIPKHNLCTSLSITIKKLLGKISYNHMGMRYLGSDNTTELEYFDFLPSYNIFNLALYYNKHITKSKSVLFGSNRNKTHSNSLLIGFRINNITNTQYRAMPDNPMPGINFGLSISYKYSNSK